MQVLKIITGERPLAGNRTTTETVSTLKSLGDKRCSANAFDGRKVRCESGNNPRKVGRDSGWFNMVCHERDIEGQSINCGIKWELVQVTELDVAG